MYLNGVFFAGDAWPVSSDTWEDAPVGEKQGSFPGFWRMGDPGAQSADGASSGAPIAPPLSDAGYGGGVRGKNRPGQVADGKDALFRGVKVLLQASFMSSLLFNMKSASLSSPTEVGIA